MGECTYVHGGSFTSYGINTARTRLYTTFVPMYLSDDRPTIPLWELFGYLARSIQKHNVSRQSAWAVSMIQYFAP
jgi:hypothetical protein